MFGKARICYVVVIDSSPPAKVNRRIISYKKSLLGSISQQASFLSNRLLPSHQKIIEINAILLTHSADLYIITYTKALECEGAYNCWVRTVLVSLKKGAPTPLDSRVFLFFCLSPIIMQFVLYRNKKFSV